MHFLFAIFISLFFSPCTLSATVNAGPSGFNQSGLMIGHYQAISSKGIFIKRRYVPFLLGAGLGDSSAYPPIEYPLQIKTPHIADILKTLAPDKPIIIHYKKQIKHWRGWHLLGLMPPTFITNLSEPVQFSSPGTTGNQRWSALDETGKLNTMQASGFILRLFRFGTFNELCSISVHLGGESKESSPVHQSTLIGLDENDRLIEDSTALIINKSIAHVGHFNIASEDGCQFAENALKAGAMVEVAFSKRYFKLFNLHSNTVHTIKQLNNGLFSIPKAE